MALLWYFMILKDRVLSVEVLKTYWANTSWNIADSQTNAFVASKNYMTNDEALEMVRYLLSHRNNSPKFLIRLIYGFSGRVSEGLEVCVNMLDDESPLDLPIRIRLLGFIGSKHPERVFGRLLEYSNLTGQQKGHVIRALEMLSPDYRSKVMEVYMKFLETETHPNNRDRMNRKINSWNIANY